MRTLALLATLVIAACDGSHPTLPLDAATFGVAGTRTGGVMPHPGDSYASEPLASTCDAPVSTSYSLVFGKSGCLIVQPTGSSYALTDDVVLSAVTKGGRIVSYQLRAQDVSGADGIKHESEVVMLPEAVRPSTGAFVVHVHQDRIPVWRLSGHRKGERVEIIGYISIGDVVYTAAQ